MEPDTENRRSLSESLDAPAQSPAQSLDWVLVFLAVLLAIRFGAAIAMRSQFTSTLAYGAT
jgi:hypothetical protein